MKPNVPTGRIPSLDGWRGIAILLVLWGHFFPVDWFHLATFGVEFFFILSGRLMAQILFLNELPLPKFYLRRVARILPGLIGFVVIYLIVSSILGEPFTLSPLWGVSALTFTLNYLVLLTHPTGWFDHIWSLCVEEHAYILLGGLIFVFGRSARTAIWVTGSVALLMMANGVVSSVFLHHDYAMVYYRSDVHVGSILISVALFLALRTQMDEAWLRKLALPLFLASMVAGIALNVNAVPISLKFTAGTICLATAVALVDIASKPIARVFANPVLARCGLWSYSIYLWQQPFYQFKDMYPGHTVYLCYAAITCGIASFYLIEQPGRYLINAGWPQAETFLARHWKQLAHLPKRSLLGS